MLQTLQVHGAGHPGKTIFGSVSIFYFMLFSVSFLDVASIIGYLIGNYSSTTVFEKAGFNGIFGLTGAFLVLNLLYTFFFLEESRYSISKQA